MGIRTLKILVVEDNRDTRMFLAEYIRLLGHDCKLAEDAAVAILTAIGGTFDVLLTDVHMPRIDGFELVEILRGRGVLPALVISMSAGGGESERSRTAGCHKHLLKPFQVDELEAALAA